MKKFAMLLFGLFFMLTMSVSAQNTPQCYNEQILYKGECITQFNETFNLGIFTFNLTNFGQGAFVIRMQSETIHIVWNPYSFGIDRMSYPQVSGFRVYTDLTISGEPCVTSYWGNSEEHLENTKGCSADFDSSIESMNQQITHPETSFDCLAETSDAGATVSRPDFENDAEMLSFIMQARELNPNAQLIEDYWNAKGSLGFKYYVMFGNAELNGIQPGISTQATWASDYQPFYINVSINGDVYSGWFVELTTACGQDVTIVTLQFGSPADTAEHFAVFSRPYTYLEVVR